MNSLFDRLDEVQVPNEILAPLLNVQPEVVPEFFGIDSHSDLAHILYESNYLKRARRSSISPNCGRKFLVTRRLSDSNAAIPLGANPG